MKTCLIALLAGMMALLTLSGETPSEKVQLIVIMPNAGAIRVKLFDSQGKIFSEALVREKETGPLAAAKLLPGKYLLVTEKDCFFERTNILATEEVSVQKNTEAKFPQVVDFSRLEWIRAHISLNLKNDSLKKLYDMRYPAQLQKTLNAKLAPIIVLRSKEGILDPYYYYFLDLVDSDQDGVYGGFLDLAYPVNGRYTYHLLKVTEDFYTPHGGLDELRKHYQNFQLAVIRETDVKPDHDIEIAIPE